MKLIALLSLLSACCDCRKVVHVPGFPDSPLFSHAIVSGSTVYVAGTVGVNITSVANGGEPSLCAGGIKAETVCAFALIGKVLNAAGSECKANRIRTHAAATLASRAAHSVAASDSQLSVDWAIPLVTATLDKVVDCTVFVGNLTRDYGPLNEAYVTIFPKDPPARAAFGANGLALNAAAEFKCVAEL
jgi:2-iminobutanoate/2-iminopropanoate deaminase